MRFFCFSAMTDDLFISSMVLICARGNPRQSMIIHDLVDGAHLRGNPWQSMALHGTPWHSMANL